MHTSERGKLERTVHRLPVEAAHVVAGEFADLIAETVGVLGDLGGEYFNLLPSHAVVTRAPEPLARARPGISPAVYDLVGRLLGKDPSSRPGAAA
mgnify:CR=1 FL=1